ncbi:MAG: VRR-NUC domain-containing protein, partial [Minisyncoccia bacterium]
MSSPWENIFDATFAEGGKRHALAKGWPDRLVKEEDGTIYAVEVKSSSSMKDPLRPHQLKMCEWLEKAGLQVFVAPG